MSGRIHSVQIGAAVLLAACASMLAVSLHGCSDSGTSPTGSLPETTLYQLYSGQSACLAFNCHPATPLAIYPPASGEHRTHLGLAEFGPKLSCGSCHDGYNANLLHKNGYINGYNWFLKTKTSGMVVHFGPDVIGSTFDKSASTCSGTGASCHGAGPSDNWYNGAGGTCGNSASCHLAAPLSEYPPMSGAHAIHRYQTRIRNVNCTTCHYSYFGNALHRNTAVNGSTLDPKATVTASVVFFDPAKTTAGSWNNTTADCSSLSCHGTKNWYNYPSLSQCPVCHPYSPLYQYPPTSGLHNLHRAEGENCNACHNTYASSYVKNVSLHNNQVINGYNRFTRQIVPGNIVIFQSGGTYDHNTGNCDPSCHGNENWYTGGGG